MQLDVQTGSSQCTMSALSWAPSSTSWCDWLLNPLDSTVLAGVLWGSNRPVTSNWCTVTWEGLYSALSSDYTHSLSSGHGECKTCWKHSYVTLMVCNCNFTIRSNDALQLRSDWNGSPKETENFFNIRPIIHGGVCTIALTSSFKTAIKL